MINHKKVKIIKDILYEKFYEIEQQENTNMIDIEQALKEILGLEVAKEYD